MNEHYFLGSSSPCGFVTPIKELLGDTDNTVYLLKGTAGCGKSTLMKKISAAFSDEPQEIYHCSSDPDSLDAVYLKNRKAIIMDGTAPHCFDPVYPKAVESIIDLGAYLDTAKLRQNKKDIITVTDECAGFHKRCRLCLGYFLGNIRYAFRRSRVPGYRKAERLYQPYIKEAYPKKNRKNSLRQGNCKAAFGNDHERLQDLSP